jgi:hypothetical protein
LVEDVVRVVKQPGVWGEGLRRCAGTLADHLEFDAAMEQIRRERKAAQFREVSE